MSENKNNENVLFTPSMFDFRQRHGTNGVSFANIESADQTTNWWSGSNNQIPPRIAASSTPSTAGFFNQNKPAVAQANTNFMQDLSDQERVNQTQPVIDGESNSMDIWGSEGARTSLVNTGLSAAQLGLNTWLGLRSVRAADKARRESTRQFNLNFGMQRGLMEDTLRRNYRSRNAGVGTTQAQEDSYIDSLNLPTE